MQSQWNMLYFGIMERRNCLRFELTVIILQIQRKCINICIFVVYFAALLSFFHQSFMFYHTFFMTQINVFLRLVFRYTMYMYMYFLDKQVVTTLVLTGEFLLGMIDHTHLIHKCLWFIFWFIFKHFSGLFDYYYTLKQPFVDLSFNFLDVHKP